MLSRLAYPAFQSVEITASYFQAGMGFKLPDTSWAGNVNFRYPTANDVDTNKQQVFFQQGW